MFKQRKSITKIQGQHQNVHTYEIYFSLHQLLSSRHGIKALGDQKHQGTQTPTCLLLYLVHVTKKKNPPIQRSPPCTGPCRTWIASYEK